MNDFSNTDCNDYMRRAYAAYFKMGGIIQPISDKSTIEEHEGLSYVILRGSEGILAVYRITTTWALKRLKRYPSSISK